LCPPPPPLNLTPLAIASGWFDLTGGVRHEDDPPSAIVTSIATLPLRNDLIVFVAGHFTHAGTVTSRSVAAWRQSDGSWAPLQEGVGGSIPYVAAIVVGEGVLYVGGYFSTAGADIVPAGLIAAWNHTAGSWDTMGGGVVGFSVNALAFDSATGTLYVGGVFSAVAGGSSSALNVAAYRGGMWWSVGQGIDRDVNVLTILKEGTPLADADLVAGLGSGGRAGRGAILAEFRSGQWGNVLFGSAGATVYAVAEGRGGEGEILH
jgi:trimeric autotransporter adhesin